MPRHRIYIDNSALNRPFDDWNQERIRVEGESLLLIIERIRRGDLDLVASEWSRLENDRSPHATSRKWIESVLNLAVLEQMFDAAIEPRARELRSKGIRAMDALHAATAEAAGIEYFLTCDHKLVRRYSGPLRMISPADFVSELSRPGDLFGEAHNEDA